MLKEALRQWELPVDKPDGYFEIQFSPHWKFISPARVFLQNFAAVAVSDQAKADALALATSELLENAVKYGASEDTRCVVRAYSDTGALQAAVSNHATEESVRELRAVFEKIQTGDPLEAFISQMRQASTRTDGKSQLGLARIRYEAGGQMSIEITPERLVTVTVTL
jgi:hypothetical protein